MQAAAAVAYLGWRECQALQACEYFVARLCHGARIQVDNDAAQLGYVLFAPLLGAGL
jgi:hypothetical protein